MIHVKLPAHSKIQNPVLQYMCSQIMLVWLTGFSSIVEIWISIGFSLQHLTNHHDYNDFKDLNSQFLPCIKRADEQIMSITTISLIIGQRCNNLRKVIYNLYLHIWVSHDTYDHVIAIQALGNQFIFTSGC